MHSPLSMFNLSIKKLLLTECDVFEKAKTRILFTILLFSIAKIVIGVSVTWYFGQYFQLARVLVLLFLYLGLLKLLLSDKKYKKVITHSMICTGLILIWSNIFFYVQDINIITSQFIFMLILSSFYLLNSREAIIYACLSSLPIFLYLVFKEQLMFTSVAPEGLASPGFEVIVLLNFATIIFSHYLFKQAFVENIKEKEALNTQLNWAVQEANQASESKSNFLSTMSHELRTPLNAVIGISDLLLIEPHNKEQEENLNILKFSAGNLHTLINDILDYNKLGSGKLTLESIPVDLNELLNDLSLSLRFQAIQKGIDFDLEIDQGNTDLRVITDPTRITQIVYNLAGNAIKFTEKGSVKLSLRLLCVDNNHINVKISVTDTGIGIDPDKQQAIFEPFTQASSTTTRNYGGTGLGLAIVKRLLFLFESAIQVDSKPGLGSTFSFEMMLEQDLNPVKPQIQDLTHYDLEGLRILVAEDNAMNRILLMKIFSKWNVSLEFALNGQEAIDKLVEHNFDVILMDIHMPIKDGYEAAKFIRAMSDSVKSKIRIITLTASVSGNLNEKIKAVGMDDYLLKPFKMNELYVKLQFNKMNSADTVCLS